mmetsp:Transcript_10943/g.18207  ORF Transcript_10943/g.18207 Transcript_10943/m.18207 type:complete len:209 (+) Transcript_10943:520-1146(+)
MCKRKLQRKFVVFRQPYDVSKTRVDRFNLIFVLLEESVIIKEVIDILNGQRLDLLPLKGRAGEASFLKGHRGRQVPHRVVQPVHEGQLPQGGGDQQHALQGQLGLRLTLQLRHRLPGVQLAVPGPAQHGVQLLVQDDVGRVPEVREGVGGRQHRRLGSAVGQPDALKGPAAHAVAAVQCAVVVLVVVIGEVPVGVVRRLPVLCGLHPW